MSKNLKIQTTAIDNLIKRHKSAVVQRSKDIRITVDEASLIIGEISQILAKLEELSAKNSSKPAEKKEETIQIDFDAGSFRKNKG